MTPLRAGRGRRLIGREPLLDAVAEPLRGLAHGVGALVLLAGEPGIGKTRLAEEIAGRARSRGARVAWASSWRGDAAPPLWPWMQVLRELFGDAAALDQPQPETPTASSAARFKQLDSVLESLRLAACASPLVIVIDDLQWADAGSVVMLTFLAAALRNVPCLLIGTCRPDEMRPDDLVELSRVGMTLALPPLDDDAAAELLRASVAGDVGPDAVAAIVRRSAGNPLFVWEFGQLMSQSGRTDVAPAAVPPAVAAVIERRLARLAEGDVAVLRAAAIAGVSFGAEPVREIAVVDTATFARALSAATAAGLVERTDETRFAFSHDLVRDVVLATLDDRGRAELHARAAVVFLGDVDAEPSFHAVAADHLAQAGPDHAAAAERAWRAAGEHARTLLAYEDAARYFRRAAECAVDTRVRGERRMDEGNAWLLAGHLDAARAAFKAAIAVGRSLGDAQLVAGAVLGVGTGPVAWEVPQGTTEQRRLIEETLASLPEDATRLRSMLLARLSVAAATPETTELARERADQALTLAQVDGDPALIGQALAALNDAIAGPRHTVTRRDNADAIVELANQAGDRALELLGYRFRIVADLELGDIAAVDRDIEAFERLATALRQPLLSWFVPLFRGMRAHLAGNMDAAWRHQQAVEAAAASTRSHNANLMALTLRFRLDVAGGQPPATDYFDASFFADPADWATYAAGLSYLRLQMGDVDRARELLALHADNGFARVGYDSEHLTTLVMFGRVARALDETAAAETLIEWLSPYSGLWAVDGIAGACWGPVDLELGHLALALGRRDDAVEFATRARASVDDAPFLAAEVEDLMRQLRTDAPPRPDSPSKVAVGRNLFRAEGPFFSLDYRDRSVRVPASKGLHDLASLLAEPGREFHVADLAGQPAGDGPVASGDLGELLDARARAEYKRRLAELDDDLAEAEAAADLGRAEKVRTERDFLITELTAAIGLGGRPRRTGDPAERARKAVSGRIRLAIDRLEEPHPELARHLRNAVRTGTYCVYIPESETVWAT